MAERAADDFPAIAARLKIIQAELSQGIKGTPEQAPAAPAATSTGSGGFITPTGQPYQSYEG